MKKVEKVEVNADEDDEHRLVLNDANSLCGLK